ncbi:amidase family protein [Pseudalkalibacillus caeni]|uniref:Amidase n=1 Tax=Exobacillus caeni TaxID=2574798 RepID=A0A5R9F7E2_9BACL|nr:amidase family protein [Pseudalkalibacillus caeni]TLS38256.1 amidase [Pseudalkalibacillus caeni]
MLDIDWLETATITDIQNEMNYKRLSSKELVLYYLERIAQYNGKINAVLEINPDAIFIAEAMDYEREQHRVRGPLHGIPVLIKDNIDTADKMHTSAGSLALANSYAEEDAFIAKQLRNAGAVILGKTNMTEWANFMTENMPSGYSSRGGQVQNPYGPGTFDVGGSSSGSGAAIASNFAVAAIGTETSGSILNPANQNSLVGIKPTVGLVSRSGIIPIAHSQDTAGPMTKNVTDAAILLNTIKGIDEKDPATIMSEKVAYIDYTGYLLEDGLLNSRIGIPPEGYMKHLSSEQQEIYNNSLEVLKQKGATLVELEMISPIEKEKEWDFNVLLYEFKSALNAYLATVSNGLPVHSLKELIAFNHEHEEKMLKYGQTLLIDSQATSGNLTDSAYLQSKLNDMKLARKEGIDRVINENNLDAIFFPKDMGSGIPAKAGYPSITIPAGYDSDGQPFGVMFTGQAYSEYTLIKLGYSFEQATKVRTPPALS